VAVSVVALALVISRVDLPSVAGLIGSANPVLLIGLIATTCIDLACRTRRWQGLVSPIRRISIVRILGYLLVGYLANNLLPARLGELVRAHYLGDREGLSRTTALGTIVVERLVDTAVLVTIATAAIVVLQVRGVVASAALVGLVLTGVLVVAVAIAVRADRLSFVGRMAGLSRWPRARSVASRLREGLAVAGQPRILIPAVAWSCLAWAATVVGFAAAGQAIGIQLTPVQAALLTSGVALSTAIPAGPGYVGTFELAGVQIAAGFGIPADFAFALTLLAHVSSLLVTSAGGAIALSLLGWRRP
jgi:glycosyltransferase 2 family protein